MECLRVKSADHLPPEVPRSELSDPVEAAATLLATGDREGAIALLQPYVLQQLEAGDLSFRLQVPGVYSSMKAQNWSRRIAERLVGNLQSLLDRTTEDLRSAGDDGEKEEHAIRDLALGLLLLAGLESDRLLREGERDCFNRSMREDVWKVWVHGMTRAPEDPREIHVAMNGEKVHCKVGEDNFFSNGARWPRDTEYLPVEEVMFCSCGLIYVTEFEW